MLGKTQYVRGRTVVFWHAYLSILSQTSIADYNGKIGFIVCHACRAHVLEIKKGRDLSRKQRLLCT